MRFWVSAVSFGISKFNQHIIFDFIKSFLIVFVSRIVCLFKTQSQIRLKLKGCAMRDVDFYIYKRIASWINTFESLAETTTPLSASESGWPKWGPPLERGRAHRKGEAALVVAAEATPGSSTANLRWISWSIHASLLIKRGVEILIAAQTDRKMKTPLPKRKKTQRVRLPFAARNINLLSL